jgi:branched-chain amino acid transport system substrate-binding protein
MVVGLKRYYKGRIVEEIYTKLGQQDYQAELTQLRSKNPKAVWVFLPGGMGIQFLKQYDQAGLRGKLPLYTSFTVDEISIPAVKDAALGIYETRFWSPDLNTPANRRYVTDYKKKYGKLPVFYGAQSYEGIMLIDSAIKATKGNLKDTQALVKAMRKASYPSIRGPYQFNVNHHPIQNFYLLRTEKLASGDIEMRIQKTIFEKHKDSYYQDCKMKW